MNSGIEKPIVPLGGHISGTSFLHSLLLVLSARCYSFEEFITLQVGRIVFTKNLTAFACKQAFILKSLDQCPSHQTVNFKRVLFSPETIGLHTSNFILSY